MYRKRILWIRVSGPFLTTHMGTAIRAGDSCAGLAAQQWERKRAAAKAIARLAESHQGPFEEHAPSLAAALLKVKPAPSSCHIRCCTCLEPCTSGVFRLETQLQTTAAKRSEGGFLLRMQELPGRVWEGKDGMLRALAAIVKAAPKRFSEPAAEPSAQQTVEALTAAAQRPTASFRAAAVAGLETALQSLQSDFYEVVGLLLQNAIAAAQVPKPKVWP